MESRPSEELLRRQVLGQYLRGRSSSVAGDPRESAQRIPVNVYETPKEVVVVAPMPGVESDDIDIEVMGRSLTLRARLRGRDQFDRQYAIHEWTYGPYERTVELPEDVDAAKAKATHGNGVLAVALPKAQRARSVTIKLGGS